MDYRLMAESCKLIKRNYGYPRFCCINSPWEKFKWAWLQYGFTYETIHLKKIIFSLKTSCGKFGKKFEVGYNYH